MFETTRTLWIVSCCAAYFVVAGCEDEHHDTGGGTPVIVTVEEYEVIVDPDTAPAGTISFHVTNVGDETHEFVVVDTDLAPDKLPMKDGEVDEESGDLEVIDELEDIEPGDTKSLTVSLERGKHVLICNRVEELGDGGVESHYAHGMRTAFTVE